MVTRIRITRNCFIFALVKQLRTLISVKQWGCSDSSNSKQCQLETSICVTIHMGLLLKAKGCMEQAFESEYVICLLIYVYVLWISPWLTIFASFTFTEYLINTLIWCKASVKCTMWHTQNVINISLIQSFAFRLKITVLRIVDMAIFGYWNSHCIVNKEVAYQMCMLAWSHK